MSEEAAKPEPPMINVRVVSVKQQSKSEESLSSFKDTLSPETAPKDRLSLSEPHHEIRLNNSTPALVLPIRAVAAVQATSADARASPQLRVKKTDTSKKKEKVRRSIFFFFCFFFFFEMLFSTQDHKKRFSGALRRRATTERSKEAFPGLSVKTVSDCIACGKSSDASCFLKCSNCKRETCSSCTVLRVLDGKQRLACASCAARAAREAALRQKTGKVFVFFLLFCFRVLNFFLARLLRLQKFRQESQPCR